MYMITPRDQISQDLSYFSGPKTSGAAKKVQYLPPKSMKMIVVIVPDLPT